MSYRIITPRGTFLSLRECVEKTFLTDYQVRKLCNQPNSGWRMEPHGSRSDAKHYGQDSEWQRREQTRQEWLATANSNPPPVAKPRMPEPVASTVPVASDDLLKELQALRDDIARLRGEVVELTAQALNAMTLPAGTQLNLPLPH